MTTKDPIALIKGAHGFGISAALIASLGAAGVCVVNLDEDGEIEKRRRARAVSDRLDISDMLVGTGSRSSRYPDRPPPAPRREIQFNDTPKPLSKRRARRMRGKGAA